MAVRFVRGSIDEKYKAYYRATRTYRQAARYGADDRQALTAATQAEQRALDRLQELAAGIAAQSEVEGVRHAVRSDSLLSDFVWGIGWAGDSQGVVYRAPPDSGWVGFFQCGGTAATTPNMRNWDEWLAHMVRLACEEVQGIQVGMRQARNHPGFCASLLGKSNGTFYSQSRVDLLKRLEDF